VIVALAGLPGTGKSTLGRALAAHCKGAIVSKDLLRAAAFPPPWTAHTTAQDDFVMTLMLQTSEWLVREQRCPAVFLDGRTFSRRYQRDIASRTARDLGRPFHLIECVCRDESAIARIGRDATHPAANRNADLYWRMKSSFEPIGDPFLRVDTDRTLDVCVGQCLRALASPACVNPVAE
jgi:predicted kinase